MSARDVLETNIDPAVPDGGRASIDAYRVEVLAEADLLPKADVVAWLVKKAREGDPIENLASKAARGAIRPDNLRMLPPKFFEPGHSYTHRNGTDFHCVAVTDHPQTGERLAMGWHIDSWGLHYPATVGINQWRHEYDGVQAPADTTTGGGEKATAPAPTATPSPTGRVKQLLDAIRTTPGVWTTGKAFQMYRLLPANASLPLGMVRNLARGDLRLLAEAGHLTVTETTGRREYRLNTRKDVRP